MGVQQENAWDNMVGDLYDAVLQQDQYNLHQALTSFERLIDSDGCHLFGVDKQGRELFTLVTYPEDVDTDAYPYYSHYIHIDPRLELTRRHPGQAQRSADHFDAAFIAHNEFFQDYLLPRGRLHISGGVLFKTEQLSSVVAFNRFKGRTDFNDAEMAAIHRYFPHLRRAVHMGMQENAATLLHGTQSDLLQQQDVGVLGLDQNKRVLFINPAARQHLALLPQLGWQGASVRTDGPLALACQQAHASRQPQAMRQRVAEGEVVVTAWATPRRAHERWLPSVASASDTPLHTCVLVQLLRPGQRITPSLLMKLYGLTAAEARLAKELVQGTAVEDYALKFSVSVATVRTQLRQVLAKTGYERQQDLVRHLAAIQVL